MKKVFAIGIIVLCSVLQSVSCGYKILGVFPNTSPSHYMVGLALMKGLAAKGHKVSVITAFPCNEHIENLEEIPIPGVLEHFQDIHNSLQRSGDKSFLQMYFEMVTIGRTLSEKVLEQPVVQELLASPNRTFDLVISEIFINDALFGFAQHFNAPIIGVSPMGNTPWTSVLTGSPMPPSFVPNIFLGNTDHMSFPERALNLAALTVQYLGYHFEWLPYQAKVYKKFFPNARLTLPEVLKNVSLTLLNQHVSIASPQPLVHNMVEVAGLHIQREVKPLPERIREFLDNATDGVIYFSMGTNWRSDSLRKEKFDALVNTFRSLKQRVIWKYENSSFHGKPDNVLTGEWLPQSDILAHPNVKLFITHGGMLGTTEAVYHAKPLLGIPMLCDQFLNVARATAAGYALKLPYTQLNEERLKSAVREMFTNPVYAVKAKQVSARYRDQPMTPLDKAVYWVEYVLRHKGAPHLRSVALDLNFFQYHSLDTIPVVFGAALLIVYLCGRLLKRLVSSLLGLDKSAKQKTS